MLRISQKVCTCCTSLRIALLWAWVMLIAAALVARLYCPAALMTCDMPCKAGPGPGTVAAPP